jgi:hypothetical protein
MRRLRPQIYKTTRANRFWSVLRSSPLFPVRAPYQRFDATLHSRESGFALLHSQKQGHPLRRGAPPQGRGRALRELSRGGSVLGRDQHGFQAVGRHYGRAGDGVFLMPEAGLEPACLAARDFKSPASAISPLRRPLHLSSARDKIGACANKPSSGLPWR